MRATFLAIEQWPLSVWMREDAYAYFVALIFHALGMALMIGAGIAVSLCFAGVVPVSIPRARGFFPVILAGAALAIASGLLLLVAYPAKAMTNPVFAIKFLCLGIGAWLLRSAKDAPAVSTRTRRIGFSVLSSWLGAVAAGKLLLHTAKVLLVGDGT